MPAGQLLAFFSKVRADLASAWVVVSLLSPDLLGDPVPGCLGPFLRRFPGQMGKLASGRYYYYYYYSSFAYAA